MEGRRLLRLDPQTAKGTAVATTNDDSKTRAIITVLGSDRPGIVAAVTSALAGHDANILDISQTILQGIFTMTMLVDLAGSSADFSAIQDQLAQISSELGVQITMQREEVFNFMYRL
jgi:ACT domain-containing protein